MERSKTDITRELLLLLTSTLVIMADFTVSPALPGIKEAFKDTPNIELLTRLVLTMPALFIVLSSPFLGYLMDKWGRKPVILISIALFIISGSSGYFAGSIYEILLGRAIFGIAVSGVITGCITLISDYYSGAELSRLIGLQSAFIGFSGLFYLFIGGVLADISWRTPFLVYLAPVVLFFLFIIFIYEPQINRPAQIHPENKNAPGHGFLIKLFQLYVLSFLLMLFFYMVPLQVPFYLESSSNLNRAQIGLIIGLMPFCSAVFSLLYKRIKNYLSFKQIFVVGFLIMGLGYLTIASVQNYLITSIGLIITGVSMGFLIPNFRVWTAVSAEPHFMGRAVGGLTTCFYLGQFFSPIFVNNIMAFGNIRTGFLFSGVLLILLSCSLAFWAFKKN